MIGTTQEYLEFKSPKYWNYFLEMYSHLLRKFNFKVSLVEVNNSSLMYTNGENIFYCKSSIKKYFQTNTNFKEHWIVAGLVGHEVAHILLSDFHSTELEHVKHKELFKLIENILEDGRVEYIPLRSLFKGRCKESLLYLREVTKKINKNISNKDKGKAFLNLLLYFVREMEYPSSISKIDKEVVEVFNEIKEDVKIYFETVEHYGRLSIVNKIYNTYLKHFNLCELEEYSEGKVNCLLENDENKVNEKSRLTIRETIKNLSSEDFDLGSPACFDELDEKKIDDLKKEIIKDFKKNSLNEHINNEILNSMRDENSELIEVFRREIDLNSKPFVKSIDFESINRISNNSARQIQGIISDRDKREKRSGFWGKSFNCSKAYDTSLKHFTSRSRESDVIDLAVLVRVDISGSMDCDLKMEAAINGTLIIYKLCEKLGIPIGIYADTADKESLKSFDLFPIAESGVFSSDNEKRICLLRPMCNNRDDMAVDFLTRKFESVKAKKKICFIISDGQPSANSTNTGKMIKNIKKTIKEGEKKQGIIYIPIGLGRDSEAIRKIYKGQNYIDSDDVSKFPLKLRKVLEREILD